MKRLLLTVLAVTLTATAAGTVGVETASAYRVAPNPITNAGAWGQVETIVWNGTGTTQAQQDALKKARHRWTAFPKARLLGTVGLAVGAFEVGWKIGRGIEERYLGWSVSPSGTETSGNSTCTGWTFKAHRFEFYTAGSGRPVDGFYLYTSSWQPNGTPNGSHDRIQNNSTCLSAYAAVAAQVNASAVSATDGPATYFVVSEEAAATLWVAQNVPYAGQSVSQTYTVGTGTWPTYGTPEANAIRDAFLADEATATANAGTATEQETAAWWIGNQLDPAWEGYPVGDFVMPNCSGLTLAQCQTALQNAGYLGTVTELELDIATADVTKPAGAVVTQSIPASTTAAADTPLELELNPAPLPLRLPEPLLGETYTAYLARLQALGYVGTATTTTLTEASGDPALGPNAPVTLSVPATAPLAPRVIRVGAPWPVTPGDRVWPDTPLEFTVNPPSYAPVPGTGGGGTASDPITPPALDFTPITGIDFGCKFPYGFINCYALGVTEWFDVAADAPAFGFDDVCVNAPGAGELCASLGTVDLNVMDSYMATLRGLISIALWVGTVYLLAVRLLNFRAGGDPGEAADEALDW